MYVCMYKLLTLEACLQHEFYLFFSTYLEIKNNNWVDSGEYKIIKTQKYVFFNLNFFKLWCPVYPAFLGFHQW